MGSSSAPAVLLFLVASSITIRLTRAGSVGVCYGMSANNLPPPSAVVGLLRANGITSVRLYSPEPNALRALGGTGISVVVDAANSDLALLASGEGSAAAWVRSNIQSHPNVNFRYLVVGNEARPGRPESLILPAMQNVRAALQAAGLARIKVTTSISQANIAVHVPPSAGDFTAQGKGFMSSVAPFLERTGAPILANLYPYFIYTLNPGGRDIRFALFTSPGTVLQDGRFGYQNQFDASVDALYTAMAKVGGPNVPVVVSETGWPSAGGAAASVENARTYNQNLARHVGRGTPRRPGRPVETYLFSMFNEDLKPAGVEQHWGVFFPNQQKVYAMQF